MNPFSCADVLTNFILTSNAAVAPKHACPPNVLSTKVTFFSHTCFQHVTM